MAKRDRDRLIQRARRTCEDCGVLLPIGTVDTPRLKYCEYCKQKVSRESNRLRAFDLYHRRKNGVPEPEKSLVEFICQECGASFSHPIGQRGPRVKRFCDDCIAVHKAATLENRKESKAEYDRNRMKEKRKAGYQKSEKEKEHNREYMQGYRERKKSQ